MKRPFTVAKYRRLLLDYLLMLGLSCDWHQPVPAHANRQVDFQDGIVDQPCGQFSRSGEREDLIIFAMDEKTTA